MIKSKRKIKKLWSTKAEEVLVPLWESKIEALRARKKNMLTYEEIRTELLNRNFNFTAEEIRVKIHNLTNKYKKERQLQRESAGSPSSWPLYSKIHSFLGKNKLNNVEFLKEDLDNYTSSSDPLSSAQISLMKTKPSSNSPPSSIVALSDSDAARPTTTPTLTFSNFEKNSFNDFQREVLNELKESNKQIEAHMRRLSIVDEQILELTEREVNAEEERNVILRKIADDNEKFQKQFLLLLSNNKNKNNG